MKKKELKPLQAKYLLADNNSRGGVYSLCAKNLKEARRYKKDFRLQNFQNRRRGALVSIHLCEEGLL